MRTTRNLLLSLPDVPFMINIDMQIFDYIFLEKGDSAASPHSVSLPPVVRNPHPGGTQVQSFLQVLLARTMLATLLTEKINSRPQPKSHTYDDINTTVVSVKGTKAATWACCSLRNSLDVTVMDSIGFVELDIARG